MIEPSPKLLSLTYKTWMFILVFLQLVELILIIWSLIITSWVFTFIENAPGQLPEFPIFNAKVFEGSLLHCEVGCEGSYESNMRSWCSNQLSPDYSPSSHCELFRSLYHSGIIYITFQSISLPLLGLQAFCTIYYVKQSKYQWLGYCSSIMNMICILAGCIMWICINKVGINNNCSSFPKAGEKIQICLNDGPIVVCCIIVLTTCFNVIYLAVSRIFSVKRKDIEKLNEEKKKKEIELEKIRKVSVSSKMTLIPERNITKQTNLSNNEQLEFEEAVATLEVLTKP